MPRPVTLLSLAILAGAGVAAVNAQDPYALPETPVTASALHLASTSKCVRSPYVIVFKAAAPAGSAFDEIAVTVDQRTSTRISGLTTASRNQVYLGPGSSRVVATVTTPGGQRVSLARRYRTCKPKKKKATRRKVSTPKPPSKPKPKPRLPAPVTEGGGED